LKDNMLDQNFIKLKKVLMADEIDKITHLDQRVVKLREEQDGNKAMMQEAALEVLKANPKLLVELISPQLGKIISKFISDALKDFSREINNKIDSGFGLKNVIRQLKAKLLGVSEFELILSEVSFEVLGIYIIFKESGLLVEKVEKTDLALDPSLFAGMLSAIRNFGSEINTEKQKSLDEIQYGNLSILIHEKNSIFFAIVNKSPYTIFHKKKLTNIIEKIFERHFFDQAMVLEIENDSEDYRANLKNDLSKVMDAITKSK